MPDFQHSWKQLPAYHCCQLAEPANLHQSTLDAPGVREEHMAQVGVLDEKKYGRLLGKYRPRIIRRYGYYGGGRYYGPGSGTGLGRVYGPGSGTGRGRW